MLPTNSWLSGVVANIDGHQSPGGKSGWAGCSVISVCGRVDWWFFDIVDLDEGTCGRRRLLPGVLRLRIAVIRPLLACPYVTIRLYNSASNGPLNLIKSVCRSFGLVLF